IAADRAIEHAAPHCLQMSAHGLLVGDRQGTHLNDDLVVISRAGDAFGDVQHRRSIRQAGHYNRAVTRHFGAASGQRHPVRRSRPACRLCSIEPEHRSASRHHVLGNGGTENTQTDDADVMSHRSSSPATILLSICDPTAAEIRMLAPSYGQTYDGFKQKM